MNVPERALRPGDLKAVYPRQLAHLNALYASAPVRCGRFQWRWHYTAGTAADSWVKLKCGDRHLWLGITAAVIADDVDFHWRNFAGDARLLAWCTSYAKVVELVQQVFQTDLVPIEIRGRFDVEHDGCAAAFCVYDDDRRIAAGQCLFEPGSVPAVDREAHAATASAVQALPLAIPIVVDRATFTPRELRHFEIGAVVLIQRRAFLDIGAELRLDAGCNELLVKVTGTRLTVVGIERRASNGVLQSERDMESEENSVRLAGEDQENTDLLPVSPISIDDMPVVLQFEAGRILTRYDELCRMQPGYTYELGHTLAEHTIDITANGALIARGELVSVGDRVGVRITALARTARDAG